MNLLKFGKLFIFPIYTAIWFPEICYVAIEDKTRVSVFLVNPCATGDPRVGDNFGNVRLESFEVTQTEERGKVYELHFELLNGVYVDDADTVSSAISRIYPDHVQCITSVFGPI